MRLNKSIIITLSLLFLAGIFYFAFYEKDDDNNTTKQEERHDESRPDSTNTNVPTDTTGSNITSDITITIDTTSTASQGVSVSGKVGKNTYVDLGLPSGTKWATYNVGANKPFQYGDYFAWGETEAKGNWEESNYKWSKDTCNTFTKYVITVDSLTTLLAEDDAATANWGSGWRMPTKAEQDELLYGCKWRWTNNFKGSGAAGRIGTSKTNGNTIFLPAAGHRHWTNRYNADDTGYYWSSSLNEGISGSAYALYFDSDDMDGESDGDNRGDGKSVRAVVK